MKSDSFFSKYAFKQRCKNKKTVVYEGLLTDCPKSILDQLENYPREKKFIMIYTAA